MDGGKHSFQEFTEYRETLNECKLTLLKAFSEWAHLGGSEANPSIKSEVAGIELMATNLIDRLETILGQPRPEPGANEGEKGNSKAKVRTVSKVVRSKSKSVTEVYTSAPLTTEASPETPGGGHK